MMKLDPETLDSLMRRRASVRADWSGSPQVIEVAERHQLLPLSADLGGVVGLLRDGRIVEIGWDDNAPAAIDDARRCDISLLLGAKRYSELGALIPQRSSDADNCEVCGGTGGLVLRGESLAQLTCGNCGGLGWIPSHWKESH